MKPLGSQIFGMIWYVPDLCLYLAAFLMCLKHTLPVNRNSLNLHLCLTCWDVPMGLTCWPLRILCGPAAGQTFGSSTPGCCSGHQLAPSSEEELATVGIVSCKEHSRSFVLWKKNAPSSTSGLSIFPPPPLSLSLRSSAKIAGCTSSSKLGSSISRPTAFLMACSNSFRRFASYSAPSNFTSGRMENVWVYWVAKCPNNLSVCPVILE